MSLGIRLNPKEWHEGDQKVRRNHHNYKRFNHELDKVRLEAQRIILDLKALDKLNPKTVVARLKGSDDENFFTYSEKYRDQLRNQGSVRNSRNLQVVLNKIEDYHGSKSLSLSDLDHEFLNGFQVHLKRKYENAQNTIRKNLKLLKRVLESARRDNYLNRNPFENYSLPSYQKSEKKALSIEQIKKLEELDLKQGSDLWHARNYFLFSFYNAGIRFGDLISLKRENIIDGRLKYVMSKTKGNRKPKWKNIQLLPQALKILALYDYENRSPNEFLFPIVDTRRDLSNPVVFENEKSRKNAIINKRLKEIAKRAGIELSLSTHIARHSFANYARKNGMSIYSISKALAHSKLSTTEQYLESFDEEMLDNEMEQLFDY
jgi:site-specific recombinase XerD